MGVTGDYFFLFLLLVAPQRLKLICIIVKLLVVICKVPQNSFTSSHFFLARLGKFSKAIKYFAVFSLLFFSTLPGSAAP